MHKLQAIALDLDGTLLTSQGVASDNTVHYLKKLRDEGMEIVLASGRMTDRIMPTALAFGPPLTLIAYNGARVHTWKGGRDMTTDLSSTVSAETCEAVISICLQRRLFLNVYSGDGIVGFHPDGEYSQAKVYRDQNGAAYGALVADAASLPKENIAKLLIVTTPEERDALYEACLPDLSRDCSILKSNPEYLEFMDHGVNKGKALLWWLRHKGLDRERVAAFGDAENDLEMLRSVGHGIAVGNATPGLKREYARVSRYGQDEEVIVREMRVLLAG